MDSIKQKFDAVPGRVSAAMQFVQHCLWLTDPPIGCDYVVRGRPLTPAEQATYLAALDAMRQYFAGEVDFGGPPAVRPFKTHDGEAQDKVGDEKKGKKRRNKD